MLRPVGRLGELLHDLARPSPCVEVLLLPLPADHLRSGRRVKDFHPVADLVLALVARHVEPPCGLLAHVGLMRGRELAVRFGALANLASRRRAALVDARQRRAESRRFLAVDQLVRREASGRAFVRVPRPRDPGKM